jgi:hypothetical protein
MSNDMLSRRRALLVSLGGALGLTLPMAMIASEETEAQTTETPAAGTETRHAGLEEVPPAMMEISALQSS